MGVVTAESPGPGEGERALRAIALGAVLGLVLAVLARWRRR
ncbi:MAG: hypothetical protein ACXWW5_05555 [Actinomycetota bacterium]